MIRMRHQQPNLRETFFAEEVAALWEPWMRAVDELLDDNEFGRLAQLQEAENQIITHDEVSDIGQPTSGC